MSDIAINPVTRRVQFTGNTGTGPYAFNFNILQSSDIVVYKNNVLLTETTDYTVSIAANGTGNITLTAALVLADILTIIGGRELSRTTDFVTAGDLLASSLNEQLDSNVIMSQQLDERFGRTIKAQPGDEDATLDLPTVANRANKIILFDTEGNVTAASATDFFTNSVLGGNYIVNTATGDGSQTAFGLTVAPGVATNIQIHIDGVYQNKATFSLSGSTVTFSEAPPLNSSIEFIMGEAVTQITGNASAITYNQGGTGAQDRTVQSKLQEFVSVKDFGAVGDGVADDSSAFLAALTASDHVIVPNGNFLITTTIVIPAANKTIKGMGGVIVRGASVGTVFSATSKDNLNFVDLDFQVSSSQTHVQTGEFIVLTTCHDCSVIGCTFDAEIKAAGSNKESLFSAVNTPSCNRLMIANNKFLYLYGNCCGANDSVGNGVNGNNVTITGNLFYNHVDTGVGTWTNARDVTISNNVFHRDDFTTSYNGVSIDVAGAQRVSITGNVFTGQTIAIRVLSNLGYVNRGVVIDGNTFGEATDGSSEPAVGIRRPHYTNSGVSNFEDMTITNNTFKVSKKGIDIISTVTDTTKWLDLLISGNRFDLSETNSVGIHSQKLTTTGALRIVPATNSAVNIGSGATLIGGAWPNGSRRLMSEENQVFMRNDFQFTGTSASTFGTFKLDRGIYAITYGLGTCTDVAGVGGTLILKNIAGTSQTSIAAADIIVNAAASDSENNAQWYVINTPDVYYLEFTPHPSGHTHNYHYLGMVRVV